MNTADVSLLSLAAVERSLPRIIYVNESGVINKRHDDPLGRHSCHLQEVPSHGAVAACQHSKLGLSQCVCFMCCVCLFRCVFVDRKSVV